MSNGVIREWTPSETELHWLCRHEADRGQLVDRAMKSGNEFSFWRLDGGGGEARMACGVRRLPGRLARMWLAVNPDAVAPNSPRMVGLVTNVHQSLAGDGIIHVRCITEPDRSRPCRPWVAETLKAAGYELRTRMTSMQQDPQIVVDACPPPRSHHQCGDTVLSLKKTCEDLLVYEPLYQATVRENHENSDTSWNEMLATLEQPLLIRHFFQRQETALLLVETVDPVVWEIRYLGVAPDFRKRRQALCLLYRCAETAAVEGVGQLHTWVDSTNHAANACYARADFCISGDWCCWQASLPR